MAYIILFLFTVVHCYDALLEHCPLFCYLGVNGLSSKICYVSRHGFFLHTLGPVIQDSFMQRASRSRYTLA